MEKIIIEVPYEKRQMVKDILKAIGIKHKCLSHDRIKKEALANVSVWTEKDIDAIDNVSKSMQRLSIKEW